VCRWGWETWLLVCLLGFLVVFLGLYQAVTGVFTGATSKSDFAREKGMRNSKFLVFETLTRPLAPLVACSRLGAGLPSAVLPSVAVVTASSSRSARCPAPCSSSPAP